MTVNHLHSSVIERKVHDQNNGKNKHYFKDIIPPGKEIAYAGLDVSIWIYEILRTQEAADSHHTVPPIPNEVALSAIKDRRRKLKLHSIEIVCVFDGEQNPLKQDTKDDRNGKSNVARAKLSRLLAGGHAQDLEAVKKARRESISIRDDLLGDIKKWMDDEGIPYIQAPCEAEQQLVMLEKQGLIDAIISEDGDNLILGAKTVVTRISWKNWQGQCCCIYNSDSIWQRPCAGDGKWVGWLPELACFLGNDYITNLYGLGYAKVKEIMDKFIQLPSGEERRRLLEKLERSFSWTQDDKRDKRKATGFADKFETTAAFIRHAPVFQITQVSSDIPICLTNHASYNVELVPLNPLPGGTLAGWGDLIGFGRDPAETGHWSVSPKDFVTDTVRKNPALTRALWSDKVKSSGGRIITWALPIGLVFEHTGLYLGRAPEMRLVELWGTR